VAYPGRGSSASCDLPAPFAQETRHLSGSNSEVEILNRDGLPVMFGQAFQLDHVTAFLTRAAARPHMCGCGHPEDDETRVAPEPVSQHPLKPEPGQLHPSAAPHQQKPDSQHGQRFDDTAPQSVGEEAWAQKTLRDGPARRAR